MTKTTVSYDALLFVRMLSRLRETAGVVVVVVDDAVAAVVYYSSSMMVIAAGIVVVVAVAVGRLIRSLQSSVEKESAILRSALGSRIYSWHMLRSCSSSSLYRSSLSAVCLLGICCAVSSIVGNNRKDRSRILP